VEDVGGEAFKPIGFMPGFPGTGVTALRDNRGYCSGFALNNHAFDRPTDLIARG
jgi:hypothetical protein